MISIGDVGVPASTAQECVDLVVAADSTALAISFDSTTGACKYSTSIFSYKMRCAGEQPAFYLRADTAMKDTSAMDCLTVQDAEYLVAKLSFGDEQCLSPATYDPNRWLCVATTSFPYDLGTYMAGRTRQDAQDTFYTLGRNLHLEMAKYGCALDDSQKMMFRSVRYCYDAPNAQVSLAAIKDNRCEATIGGGAAPVKMIEERELGFLYDWAGKITYLGL
ncbi:hypothetical protein AAVH_24990 [Aphelenchoides avenae]|nr:hypothetical protein AAVH_24990 [Aphelenchus avenae]